MENCLIVFLLSIVFNISQALPTSKQLISPRQGDYHIGSRYDPFKEAINSDRFPINGDNKDSGGKLISPALRSPSLLPWEDDPEIGYVTERQPETTKSSTSSELLTSSTSSSLSPSPSSQSTTITSTPISSTDHRPGGHHIL
ncbi:uncharacterized protein LOC128390416 isoform X2 [Panonychus citri]|nr:uncharacterized protein LOC128390416 isoform X2 [Panonychus citri]